jgi:hypothetical protein
VVRRSSISVSLSVVVLLLCGAFAASAQAIAPSPLIGDWPLESSTVAGATENTPDSSKVLTRKQKVAKQTVWFQADAVLGGIF